MIYRAIGIEQDGTVTGINNYEMKVNPFLQAAFDLCVPAITILHRFVDCVNHRGEADQILLIEVLQSGKLHANVRDEVYLRIGDQSRRLSFDERMQLVYDRGDPLSGGWSKMRGYLGISVQNRCSIGAK